MSIYTANPFARSAYQNTMYARTAAMRRTAFMRKTTLPSFMPFSHVMLKPFAMPSNDWRTGPAGMSFAGFGLSSPGMGDSSNINFRSTTFNSGANIFANPFASATSINTPDINIKHSSSTTPASGINFTGLTNSSTGTRIAQLSGSNPFGNYNRTLVSGDNIESVKQTTRAVNSPFGRGTQTNTRVEDDDYIYNIRKTSWVA